MRKLGKALPLLAAVVLTLTACSSSDDAGGGELQEGGNFVVARTADIDKLDPHVATAFSTFQTLGLVYDTLTNLDKQLEPEPSLAESFEYSADGRTLTFVLRDGVTFHDGSELDSADVVASIERILDEKTGAVARTNFLSIEKVEAPDPLTVSFKLSEPDSSLPTALTTVNAAIVPEEAIDDQSIAKTPVGSGPFEFGEWKQGESVVLEANQDFWGDGPFVDSVEFRVVPEESSILSRDAGQPVPTRVAHRPAGRDPGWRRWRPHVAETPRDRLSRPNAERTSSSSRRTSRAAGDRLRDRPAGGRRLRGTG